MLVGKSEENLLLTAPVNLSSAEVLLIDGHELSRQMLAAQLTQWGGSSLRSL